MKKIVIVGSGSVGSTVAFAFALKGLAEQIVLIDQDRARAEGEMLDIQNGLPLFTGASLSVEDYAGCRGADLIVITAGRPRAPGESRLDLLEGNWSIVKNVLESLLPHYTGSYVMMISNPVDALTYLAAAHGGIPAQKLFGTGNVLDTARLQYTLAGYLRTPAQRVTAYIIGEHGDHQVPLWSHAQVDGAPLAEYCRRHSIAWNSEIRRTMEDRVRGMGATIIREKGRTQYGIAACAAFLATALQQAAETPVSISRVADEYHGMEGVACSIPTLLSSAGIRTSELPLSALEREKLGDAHKSLRASLQKWA